jgi:hypothetical protein
MDSRITISGKVSGKQAYARQPMTDKAARIFNLDVSTPGIKKSGSRLDPTGKSGYIR